MSLYTVTLYQPDGTLIADISELCLAKSFQVRRNRAEQIDLTLDLNVATDLARTTGLSFAQLFATGYNEVRIARGSRELVGGQLLYTYPRLESNRATLELKAAGFLELLSKRYLFETDTLTYSATDMGQVAWNFIDQTQSKDDGSFGITLGTIQASRTITDSWKPYASSIKDILLGLTDRINGIDIEFTPDKVFNVYYPGIGTDKTELRFGFPGNIRNLGLPIDATTLVNVSINRGAGNGLDVQPIEVRTSDPSTAVYSRREHIDDYPSVVETQTLDDKGDETLRLYATPMAIPEVTIDGTQDPPLGAYWIGDQVRFTVDNQPAFSPIDGQTWRIDEIDVSVDANDHEDITLKVGLN